MNNSSDSITGVIILGILALFYFLPTIAAYQRRHRNKEPIFIVNLFFGWTFLGWVIALAWAFTDNTHPKPARHGETVGPREGSRIEPRL